MIKNNTLEEFKLFKDVIKSNKNYHYVEVFDEYSQNLNIFIYKMFSQLYKLVIDTKHAWFKRVFIYHISQADVDLITFTMYYYWFKNNSKYLMSKIKQDKNISKKSKVLISKYKDDIISIWKYLILKGE